MPKRQAKPIAPIPVDAGDAYEPATAEIGVENQTAEYDPASLPVKNTPARQAMKWLPFARGIQDHREGQWRVEFNLDALYKKLGEEAGDQWFEQHILPMLLEQHPLKAEGGASGPVVRFHRDEDEPRQWEIRWSFNKRDEQGNEVFDASGRKQKVTFQYQVERITQQVMERANRLIGEELGIVRQSPAVEV